MSEQNEQREIEASDGIIIRAGMKSNAIGTAGSVEVSIAGTFMPDDVSDIMDLLELVRRQVQRQATKGGEFFTEGPHPLNQKARHDDPNLDVVLLLDSDSMCHYDTCALRRRTGNQLKRMVANRKVSETMSDNYNLRQSSQYAEPQPQQAASGNPKLPSSGQELRDCATCGHGWAHHDEAGAFDGVLVEASCSGFPGTCQCKKFEPLPAKEPPSTTKPKLCDVCNQPLEFSSDNDPMYECDTAVRSKCGHTIRVREADPSVDNEPSSPETKPDWTPKELASFAEKATQPQKPTEYLIRAMAKPSVETGLKPCPFCGVSVTLRQYKDWWEVTCLNPCCGVQPEIMTLPQTQKIAIAAWNRRALPPAEEGVGGGYRVREDIAQVNRAADDAGMPIPACPICNLPLNADNTHRTKEEHDACLRVPAGEGELPSLVQWNVDGTWVVSLYAAQKMRDHLLAAIKENGELKQQRESALQHIMDIGVALSVPAGMNAIQRAEELQRTLQQKDERIAELQTAVNTEHGTLYSQTEHYRSSLAEAESKLSQQREELEAANNLLAVIHCDGGHYTADRGFIKSCDDAQIVRNKLVTDLDKAQFDLGEARKAIEKAIQHLNELRDAWERGCIRETDGKGGTRSNRNMDVLEVLRAAKE